MAERLFGTIEYEYPPRGRIDDLKSAPERILNGYILQFVAQSTHRKCRDEELWDSVQEHFYGWTVETFLAAHKEAVTELRDYLRGNGVWILKARFSPIAENMAALLEEKEPHQWTEENVLEQEKTQGRYPFNSRYSTQGRERERERAERDARKEAERVAQAAQEEEEFAEREADRRRRRLERIQRDREVREALADAGVGGQPPKAERVEEVGGNEGGAGSGGGTASTGETSNSSLATSNSSLQFSSETPVGNVIFDDNSSLEEQGGATSPVQEMPANIESSSIEDFPNDFLDESTFPSLTIPCGEIRSSKIGYFVTIGNEEPAGENEFKFRGNAVDWSSTKCHRVARATLASELFAMVNGVDIGIALSTTLAKITKQLGLPDIPVVILTDSRFLYECIVKLGTTKEKRWLFGKHTRKKRSWRFGGSMGLITLGMLLRRRIPIKLWIRSLTPTK